MKKPPNVNKIFTLKQLDDNLEKMCQNIFDAISSQQAELTYQRCLKNDLEEAGVIVLQEVSIPLKYKGREVGSRRLDLVLEIKDGQRVILELKAISDLAGRTKDLRQLQYYLHHFKIDHGYLINFPHDDGFPDTDSIFRNSANLSDTNLRGKNANAKVQLIEVSRVGCITSTDKGGSSMAAAIQPTKSSMLLCSPITKPPTKNQSRISGLSTGGAEQVEVQYPGYTPGKCNAKTLKGTACKLNKPCRYHSQQY